VNSLLSKLNSIPKANPSELYIRAVKMLKDVSTADLLILRNKAEEKAPLMVSLIESVMKYRDDH
jgi:hypothetical protein